MKKRFGEQKRTYQFAFRKLSQFKHFFSLEVYQMIFLCQQKYIEDLFKKFWILECKAISTRMEVIAKLWTYEGKNL